MSGPLRVAYADPPYEGMAKMHYGKNGDRSSTGSDATPPKPR